MRHTAGNQLAQDRSGFWGSGRVGAWNSLTSARGWAGSHGTSASEAKRGLNRDSGGAEALMDVNLARYRERWAAASLEKKGLVWPLIAPAGHINNSADTGHVTRNRTRDPQRFPPSQCLPHGNAPCSAFGKPRFRFLHARCARASD